MSAIGLKISRDFYPAMTIAVTSGVSVSQHTIMFHFIFLQRRFDEKPAKTRLSSYDLIYKVMIL